MAATAGVLGYRSRVGVACLRCAAELPQGTKFCLECGAPVGSRPCPACGAVAERGRFCGECGTALDSPAAPSRLLVEPVAERRVTTVLFGDLVGFTTFSEGRDAEEVRELLTRYFARARTVVERYGGTVEKFIGDAVMAVWGVPSAHEDDAERAVRAGLDLVGTTRALGEAVGAEVLTMRVGIVTGEVAVTLGAADQGMVAGGAVNTASRVQSAAGAGEVWVDEATRSLTTAAIAYEDVGEHELKGKAIPMRLFSAGAVVASVRGAERVDGLEARVTGRDREMRLLKELFHASEESARPSLVVIEGEAGVGKSRIAWEFQKYVDGLSATVRWHRGRCLAYGEGVAFSALAEAVRARLGLVETDAGELVEERLDEGLQTYVADADERDWLRPRLAVLIGAAQASSFPREDLFAAWTTFLERAARATSSRWSSTTLSTRTTACSTSSNMCCRRRGRRSSCSPWPAPASCPDGQGWPRTLALPCCTLGCWTQPRWRGSVGLGWSAGSPSGPGCAGRTCRGRASVRSRDGPRADRP